jgi:hypothetical protein
MLVRRIVAGLGALVGLLVLFVGFSILFFVLSRRADFADQEKRLAIAKTAAADSMAPSLAADRALNDALRLDQIRMIATHNSYRKRADVLRLFYISLAAPGEARKLGYAHQSLWNQLESGLRSFELDLRYRKGHFECAHVPLVDDRSTVPDLRRGLEELLAWSEARPGHAPIVLLFEVKADYLFLDPGLKKVGSAELDQLDELLRSVFEGRLVEPDEVRGSYPSLREAVGTEGWPRLTYLRGRFVAVLHEDAALRDIYIAGRPNLEGRAMFTCAPAGAPDAAVSILNDPRAQGAAIRDRLAAGAIVRTRADADGLREAGQLEAALASGAQIVSTDFPPAYPAKDGYRAELPGGLLLAPAAR